jgi:hypothetical protein
VNGASNSEHALQYGTARTFAPFRRLSHRRMDGKSADDVVHTESMDAIKQVEQGCFLQGRTSSALP